MNPENASVHVVAGTIDLDIHTLTLMLTNIIVCLQAECRILLTGTPLQNNLVELMSILVFVMPKLFEGRKDELKSAFIMFPVSLVIDQ